MAKDKLETKPTIRDKLIEAYSYGLKDEEACLYAGISKPTLYKYNENHPKFKETVLLLKENVKMHAKKNIAKEIIEKGNIELSKYVLERTSEDFAPPKTKLDIKGNMTSGTTIQFIDDIPAGKEEETIFGKESDTK